MTSDAHGQTPLGPQDPSGKADGEHDSGSRYGIGPQPQQWESFGAQSQPWAPPGAQSQQPQPAVGRKSPAVGVLLSFFVPGLGSMVSGNVGIGVTILILNIVGWVLVIALIGIPIALGSWIWGMVDAYLSAQKWNKVHDLS